MKKINKAFKLLGLVLLISLTVMGMGLGLNILGNNKERYLDKSITIEQVDRKEEEDSEENKT